MDVWTFSELDRGNNYMNEKFELLHAATLVSAGSLLLAAQFL